MQRRNELLNQLLYYVFESKIQMILLSGIYDDTIQIWNLGKEDFSLNEFKNYESNNNDIDSILEEIKQEFNPELLGVILNDIEVFLNNLNRREEISSTEFNAFNLKLSDLKEILKGNYHDLLHHLYLEKINFRSSKHAIGYLYSMSLLVDDSIKKIELGALKQDLNVWTSNTARLILYYFDFYMQLYSSPSTIHTFRNEITLSDYEKKNLLECFQFLKKQESPATLNIIHEQAMRIIKSDNIIHESERWIWQQMKHYWKI